MGPQDVLEFWFAELGPDAWWRSDATLDDRIRERFDPCHRAASLGELAHWRESPAGRLAEVIVLDQFSRNIHRDTPASFAQDGMALVLAQEAIARGADTSLATDQRSFLYMPFMHSESGRVHEQAVELFSAPGMEQTLEFEHKHKRIIDRFGRYPHRNAILGRRSTPEEERFLREPGSRF